MGRGRLTKTMDEMEHTAIPAALKHHKSNRTKTARAPGGDQPRARPHKRQRLRRRECEFE